MRIKFRDLVDAVNLLRAEEHDFLESLDRALRPSNQFQDAFLNDVITKPTLLVPFSDYGGAGVCPATDTDRRINAKLGQLMTGVDLTQRSTDATGKNGGAAVAALEERHRVQPGFFEPAWLVLRALVELRAALGLKSVVSPSRGVAEDVWKHHSSVTEVATVGSHVVYSDNTLGVYALVMFDHFSAGNHNHSPLNVNVLLKRDVGGVKDRQQLGWDLAKAVLHLVAEGGVVDLATLMAKAEELKLAGIKDAEEVRALLKKHCPRMCQDDVDKVVGCKLGAVKDVLSATHEPELVAARAWSPLMAKVFRLLVNEYSWDAAVAASSVLTLVWSAVQSRVAAVDVSVAVHEWGVSEAARGLLSEKGSVVALVRRMATELGGMSPDNVAKAGGVRCWEC